MPRDDRRRICRQALYQGGKLQFRRDGQVRRTGEGRRDGETPSEADGATETIDLETALVEEYDCLVEGLKAAEHVPVPLHLFSWEQARTAPRQAKDADGGAVS